MSTTVTIPATTALVLRRIPGHLLDLYILDSTLTGEPVVAGPGSVFPILVNAVAL